jgi:hypothetical protein
MKKIMKIMNLLIIIFIFLVNITSIYAYEDCPYGLKNDPYPGQCGRYTDTDKSGLCDHSEKKPLALDQTQIYSQTEKQKEVEDPNDLISGEELKTKTVSEVAAIYNIKVDEFISVLKKQLNIPQISSNDTFQLLHDNYGVKPNIVKKIASGLIQWESKGQTKETPAAAGNINQQKGERNYNFVVIAFIIVALYAVSWFLSYMNMLPVVLHRRIWNILLGVNFLFTAIMGILLVIRISYGLVLPLPFNMLFWHVETGIVFSLIAIFHILWHWPYFKAMFKFSKRG